MPEASSPLFERKRFSFSEEENNKLLTLAQEYPIITSTNKDYDTFKEKQIAWLLLTEKFNSNTKIKRNTKQLKAKFYYLSKRIEKIQTTEVAEIPKADEEYFRTVAAHQEYIRARTALAEQEYIRAVATRQEETLKYIAAQQEQVLKQAIAARQEHLFKLAVAAQVQVLTLAIAAQQEQVLNHAVASRQEQVVKHEIAAREEQDLEI